MIKDIIKKNRPHVGIGVVVVKAGKVLLGKRKSSSGEWDLPGGYLENGEKVEDCALRGLHEETGLKGKSLHLGPWTHDILEEDAHRISLHIFVDYFEGEVQLKEPHKCEEWKWFDWNDLPFPLFPSIRSLILTMGMEKLKQVSFLTYPSLQNVTYPLRVKNAHPLLVKIISASSDIG